MGTGTMYDDNYGSPVQQDDFLGSYGLISVQKSTPYEEIINRQGFKPSKNVKVAIQ